MGRFWNRVSNERLAYCSAMDTDFNYISAFKLGRIIADIIDLLL
jgi:hypothetical protein